MKLVLSFLRLITLEPAIFLAFVGFTIVYGVGIQVDLLMWKICHLELNYTEETCGNLTNKGKYIEKFYYQYIHSGLQSK